MHIWVDGDACPAVIKEILFRAADRTGTPLTLVANKLLRVPPSANIRSIQVPRGFDVADDHIAGEMKPGDLVVTADVPLAAQVIDRGGVALNPRGTFYTAENVKEHLAMRNFMEEMRSAGVEGGGPAAFSNADRQAFANQLDRWLAKQR
ncbi:MAG: YaiI/YqxD family protein [Betaproteobacteria bacterium]|nr:YaiI/YqxD family protein [Betaproteobacteria bacterium]